MESNDNPNQKRDTRKRLWFCLPRDITDEQMVEFFMMLKLAQEKGYLEEEIQLHGEELPEQDVSDHC
jgi:hypothetical protein